MTTPVPHAEAALELVTAQVRQQQNKAAGRCLDGDIDAECGRIVSDLDAGDKGRLAGLLAELVARGLIELGEVDRRLEDLRRAVQDGLR